MRDRMKFDYGTAAVGGILGIGSTLLFAIYLVKPDLCQLEEVCFREWLSATSGWAAFLAAGCALAFSIKERRRDERWRRENAVTDKMSMHTDLRRGWRFAEILEKDLGYLEKLNAAAQASRGEKPIASDESQSCTIKSLFYVRNISTIIYTDAIDKISSVDIETKDRILNCLVEFDYLDAYGQISRKADFYDYKKIDLVSREVTTAILDNEIIEKIAESIKALISRLRIVAIASRNHMLHRLHPTEDRFID